jgi:hypothetical protein
MPKRLRGFARSLLAAVLAGLVDPFSIASARAANDATLFGKWRD